MAATTQPRQAPVKKTLDQVAWTWMRYSAFLLIPLAWFHLVLQDVVVNVHNMNLDYATQRMANTGWKVYDLFLLAFAFAHGMNGVRLVLRDYVHKPATYQLVSYLLLVIWLVVTAAGAIALFGTH